MARNSGGKSNFDNEIKSSIAGSDARARNKGLKEGSAAEEKQESPSEERAEVKAGRGGAPASKAPTRVAAQGNPQNTAHLQGGNMQPGAQMHQAPPQQPHMSGVGATGMEANPIIHASSIAHAILQHGNRGGMM
jgi:hypothetical protein